MDIIIIFQRMLMLLAMMGLGYLAYKKEWLDDYSYKKLSVIVVNIFNPALVINGALSAISSGGADMSVIKENFMFIVIYFSLNIILSYPIAIALSKNDNQKNVFRLMTIFSNVGFMGIPVMSSIYGEGCIIYITFYILAYNVILYTLGTFIAQKNLPKEERISGLKGIINIGTVCSVIAIIIYFAGFKFNDSVLLFFDYIGDATIPLSMIVIGVSIAKIPLSKVFQGVRLYIFALISLIIVPIVVSYVFRGLEHEKTIFGVFVLMFAMPVGSIVTMFIKEYGGDESLCSKATIITTLLSIVTIPIVASFI